MNATNSATATAGKSSVRTRCETVGLARAFSVSLGSRRLDHDGPRHEIMNRTALLVEHRAEVATRLAGDDKTPAGTFSRCLKVKESSAISAGSEYKYHAPGIGLVGDEDLQLVKSGFVKGK
jgi:hypothetical protein